MLLFGKVFIPLNHRARNRSWGWLPRYCFVSSFSGVPHSLQSVCLPNRMVIKDKHSKVYSNSLSTYLDYWPQVLLLFCCYFFPNNEHLFTYTQINHHLLAFADVMACTLSDLEHDSCLSEHISSHPSSVDISPGKGSLCLSLRTILSNFRVHLWFHLSYCHLSLNKNLIQGRFNPFSWSNLTFKKISV